jgi:zinc protease
MNRTISWPLISVFLVSPVFAEDLQIVPDINHYTLDNGLQLVVIPDHRAPVVTQTAWYKVGSADDPVGQSGIAHFLEHLMFKGTEKFPAGTLDRLVSESGGDHNAFTTYDTTAYLQTVPADVLPDIMAIEADRMRNLVLPEEVIAAERSVVENERRQVVDFDPSAVLSEEIDATLFQNHPYRVPIIGWAHEITQLDQKDALGVYERFYAPNNAVVVIAGDVTPDAALKLAEETYGKVPRGPDLPPRERPQEPKQDTARTVTLLDDRVTTPSFIQSWIVPSYRTAEPGEAEALDVLSAILSNGTLSRLNQELYINSSDASYAATFYDGGAYDYGTFGLTAAPQQGIDLKALEAKAFGEIEKIIENGVTDAELDRVKNRYLRNMIFRLDSAAGVGNYYGSWLVNGMTIEEINNRPNQIRAVTSADIQAVAAKYLVPEISVTGYLLPKAKPATEAAPASSEAAPSQPEVTEETAQ